MYKQFFFLNENKNKQESENTLINIREKILKN